MHDEMSTRPTIETVLERLSAFQDFVRQELEGLRQELGEIKREASEHHEANTLMFKRLERRIEVLSGDIVSLRSDMRMLEDRIERPEPKPS